ncbi:amino acid--tRNA ligase-related protein, partial [Corynebacterium propinquum]
MSQQKNSPDAPDSLPEQLRIRREKRQRLLDRGDQAYPVEVKRTMSLAELRKAYVVVKPEDTADAGAAPAEPEQLVTRENGVTYIQPGGDSGDEVAIAGRLLFKRDTGKLCFATLQDGDGTQVQAMLSLAEVGKEALDQWKADVDMGDFVAVQGKVISSRRGELSVFVNSWQMASKSIRPLPVSFAEMAEDTRVRQRYNDLIVRKEARENAMTRIKVIRALRNYLEGIDFVEIETPMLQTIHGGAAARPFVTHSNALDLDLYLRIAPELFLKRAVVGGIDRVFEINRNFRNEGIDRSHSPEFAMLETYQAWGDYNTGARMIREAVQYIAEEVFGSQ